MKATCRLVPFARALPTALLTVAACATFCFYNAPDRRYQRALAALDTEQFEDAAYELPHLRGRTNYEAQASLLSGTLLAAGGEYEAAMKDASVALTSPETEVRSIVLFGECLYKCEQFVDAGEMWTKALELDRDNVDALRWLGVAYYELGAIREAAYYLRRAAELRPDDPGPHRLIGQMCAERGDLATAENAYQEALRRAPRREDNDEVRFGLAAVLNRLRRPREALDLLAQSTQEANVLGLEADCEYRLGRGEKAWSLLEQALRLDPELFPALELKGRILIERQDFAAAAKGLERAVELSPKDSSALYDLALCYQRLGDADMANQLRKRTDDLRRLQMQYDELNLRAANDPRDARIRYRLAFVAADLDLTSQAGMWIRAALSLDPHNAEIRAAYRRLRSPYEADRLARQSGSSRLLWFRHVPAASPAE